MYAEEESRVTLGSAINIKTGGSVSMKWKPCSSVGRAAGTTRSSAVRARPRLRNHQTLYIMTHIQRYCGKRVKDGSEVRGYAAVGYESERVILMPVNVDDAQFHIIEVQPDRLVPVL